MDEFPIARHQRRSRILVERSVFDEVVSRMAQRYRALRVGPAMADLDVGPLISARQHEIVRVVFVRGAGQDIVRHIHEISAEHIEVLFVGIEQDGVRAVVAAAAAIRPTLHPAQPLLRAPPWT